MIVRHLEQAREVLRQAAAQDAPPRLESPPGAAAFHGVGWWLALERALRGEFPDQPFEAVLDCGSQPGLAMEALAAGVGLVRLDASSEKRRAVAEMATALGGGMIGPSGGRE